jgi:hypothetical protein
MTAFATWLETLTADARAASIAEQQYQKEAARRAAELKTERAFAWRRLNLMRAIAAAVRPAEDAAAATAAGRVAMLREVGWNGATQAQRDVADRFDPVVLAVWAATRPDAQDGGEAAAALAEFEAWYAERGTPFLALMEREIPELPLVEV